MVRLIFAPLHPCQGQAIASHSLDALALFFAGKSARLRNCLERMDLRMPDEFVPASYNVSLYSSLSTVDVHCVSGVY